MAPADSYRISRVPHYSGYCCRCRWFRLPGYHRLWPAFPDRSATCSFVVCSPSTPALPKQNRFGLFRFRSPLLTESLLFSFPVGNEMFQFPTFASRFPGWQVVQPGCPIRKSAGHRIFAPRCSLSQLITSFFASESLGIRHTPFFTFFAVLVKSFLTISRAVSYIPALYSFVFFIRFTFVSTCQWSLLRGE